MFGTATETTDGTALPLLAQAHSYCSTVACTSTFLLLYCCLHKYISNHFELSNANPLHCLLPFNLYIELSCRHLQSTVKEFNLAFVNEDSLYERFSSAQNVGNMAKAGSIEHTWVSMFSDLRNKETDVPNLNKILSPSSSAHTENAQTLSLNSWLKVSPYCMYLAYIENSDSCLNTCFISLTLLENNSLNKPYMIS
jgi:hypothetical protein